MCGCISFHYNGSTGSAQSYPLIIFYQSLGAFNSFVIAFSYMLTISLFILFSPLQINVVFGIISRLRNDPCKLSENQSLFQLFLSLYVCMYSICIRATTKEELGEAAKLPSSWKIPCLRKPDQRNFWTFPLAFFKAVKHFLYYLLQYDTDSPLLMNILFANVRRYKRNYFL